jgi:uncharacterized damage-inducible protein DinB
MTLDDLQQLLDYHYWARDRLLDAASRLSHDDLTKDLGSSFKSVRETLVHLYAALGDVSIHHPRPLGILKTGWLYGPS